MLPDIPSLKRRINGRLTDFLRSRQMMYAGFLKGVQRIRVHEGDQQEMDRADGSRSRTEYVQIAEEISFKPEELETLSLEELAQRLDLMAQKMATAQQRHALETLDHQLTEAGRAVDARGKPMSPELILEMLENLQVEFYDDGRPHTLNTVLPSHKVPQFNEALRQLLEDPQLKKRHDDLLDRKREEWRVREANRKLVG